MKILVLFILLIGCNYKKYNDREIVKEGEWRFCDYRQISIKMTSLNGERFCKEGYERNHVNIDCKAFDLCVKINNEVRNDTNN